MATSLDRIRSKAFEATAVRFAFVFIFLALVTIVGIAFRALRMMENAERTTYTAAMCAHEKWLKLSGESKRQAAKMHRCIDSLTTGLYSLAGEIDRLRLLNQHQYDLLSRRMDEILELRESVLRVSTALGTDSRRESVYSDTCCSKVRDYHDRCMSLQNDLNRLRAKYDVRILFLLDAFVSMRMCGNDAAEECAFLRRRIISAMDSAAARAGWSMRYCETARKIFAVDAVNACQSIKNINERWGFPMESAYLMALSVTDDPCALSKEEMQLIIKSCLDRFPTDTMLCDSTIRSLAVEYLSPLFIKALRQRIAR